MRIDPSWRQLLGANSLQSTLSQSADPQFLGMLGVGIKVLPMALKSLGRPQPLPARHFVTGSPKLLRVDEGFQHLHRISKVLLAILG